MEQTIAKSPTTSRRPWKQYVLLAIVIWFVLAIAISYPSDGWFLGGLLIIPYFLFIKIKKGWARNLFITTFGILLGLYGLANFIASIYILKDFLSISGSVVFFVSLIGIIWLVGYLTKSN